MVSYTVRVDKVKDYTHNEEVVLTKRNLRHATLNAFEFKLSPNTSSTPCRELTGLVQRNLKADRVFELWGLHRCWEEDSSAHTGSCWGEQDNRSSRWICNFTLNSVCLSWRFDFLRFHCGLLTFLNLSLITHFESFYVIPQFQIAPEEQCMQMVAK